MEPVLKRLGDVTIQRLEKPKDPKVGLQNDCCSLEKVKESKEESPASSEDESGDEFPFHSLKRNLPESEISLKKFKFDSGDTTLAKKCDDISRNLENVNNFSDTEMSDIETESEMESESELNEINLSAGDKTSVKNEQSEDENPNLSFLNKLVEEPFLDNPPIIPKQEPDEDYDYDIKEKLKEMGEISFETVKKGEKPKKVEVNTENEVVVTPAKKPGDNDEITVLPKGVHMRKNIREVMDETKLDEATLAAQRQEAERVRRVVEQQKILREYQRQANQERMQQKVISLLQGNNYNKPGTSSTRIGNTVLVKLPNGQTKPVTRLPKRPFDILKMGKGMQPSPMQPMSPMAAPKSPRSLLSAKKPTGNLTPSVSIAKVNKKLPIPTVVPKQEPLSETDSDGEDVKPPLQKPKSKDVPVTTIDISSDDDCIVVSENEEEETEDDPSNSGMHTNDEFNIPDEQGRVLVNVGHPENEPDVFLAPQIARIIKPHQVGGVRFLYDNVVESTSRFESSTGFGCILAHSMGLGKTLQIVCFSDIFLRHTSAKTILCIMPINTLQNWMAEYNMWVPTEEAAPNSPLNAHGEVRPRNFNLHVLNDSHKTLAARAKVIHAWRSNGGVLLIGYEQFRLLSMKKHPKSRRKPSTLEPIDDDKNKVLFDEVHEALVKPGPDLVICDEGHRIKNSHASISQALKQMSTKRRVVLTGYPLQNNLMEYWCMVDFVRPNYLGSKTEFCNMFERPIMNGQCIDSTEADIKLMRYRAHVLHSLLLGFVQRRSHTVLQTALPQKEEYVLLVRMTPFQRTLYETFMNEVVRSQAVPNPLKAFAVCCKIWNHPDVLYNFLRKRAGGDAVDIDLEEVAGATPTNVKEVKAKKPSQRRKAPPRGKNAKAAAATTEQNGTPLLPNPAKTTGPLTSFTNTISSQNSKENTQSSSFSVSSFPSNATFPTNNYYDQHFDQNAQFPTNFGNTNKEQSNTSFSQSYTENPQNQGTNYNESGNNFNLQNQSPQTTFLNLDNQNTITPLAANTSLTSLSNLSSEISLTPLKPREPISQTSQMNSNQISLTPMNATTNLSRENQAHLNQLSGNQVSLIPTSQHNSNQQNATSRENHITQLNPASSIDNQFSQLNSGQISLTPLNPNQNMPPPSSQNSQYNQNQGFNHTNRQYTSMNQTGVQNYNTENTSPSQNFNQSPQSFTQGNKQQVQNFNQNPAYNQGSVQNQNYNNDPNIGYSPSNNSQTQNFNQGPKHQSQAFTNVNNTSNQSFNTNYNQSNNQQDSGFNQEFGNNQQNVPFNEVSNQTGFNNGQNPNYNQTATNVTYNASSQQQNQNYNQGSNFNQNTNQQQFNQNYNQQNLNQNQEDFNFNQGNCQKANFPLQNQNFSPNSQASGFNQRTSQNYNQGTNQNFEQNNFQQPQNYWQQPDGSFNNQQNNYFNQQQQQNFNPNFSSGNANQSWIKKEDSKSNVISNHLISPVKSETSNDSKPKINIISDIKLPPVFPSASLDKKINIISDIKIEPKLEEIDDKFDVKKEIIKLKNELKSEFKNEEESKIPVPVNEPALPKLTSLLPLKDSKEDSGIPYDWAIELLKDYMPGCIENSAKMEILFCIIRESIALGDRLLVFSQSLITLDLIEQFLQTNTVPGDSSNWARNTSYFRLDGSTSALEREKLINEFNCNPKVHLFLVSTRAGSLGINLIGANRVIVLDASWNPCHDTQAVCRVYRYGQKKPCFVYRLVVDNCLEKKIYDRQVNKQGMSDRIVDECNPDAHLTMKDVSTLCWDDKKDEGEEKDWSHMKDNYSDSVLKKVLTLHGRRLNKEPFQHESLLVDRKEKQLSSQEKRLAKKGYEREKQAARQPSYYRPMPPMRSMHHAERPSRWIPAEHWQRQGMTAQEMTLPLDVVIPTNQPEKGNIVLKAGQKVLVLKSPKGVYMQLESGKIVAIKTAIKVKGKAEDNDPMKMTNKPIQLPQLPPSTKINSTSSVIPPQKKIIKPFQPGVAKFNVRSIRQAVPNLVSRIQSVTKKVQIPKTKYGVGTEIAKSLKETEPLPGSSSEDEHMMGMPSERMERPKPPVVERLNGPEEIQKRLSMLKNKQISIQRVPAQPPKQVTQVPKSVEERKPTKNVNALEQLEQTASSVLNDNTPFQNTLDRITSNFKADDLETLENLDEEEPSDEEEEEDPSMAEAKLSHDQSEVSDDHSDEVTYVSEQSPNSSYSQANNPPSSVDSSKNENAQEYSNYNNYYNYPPYHTPHPPPPQGYTYPAQHPPPYDMMGYSQPQQPQYNYGYQGYPPPPPPQHYPPPPQQPGYDYNAPPQPMYPGYHNPYPPQYPPSQGMYPPPAPNTAPPYPDYQYQQSAPPPTQPYYSNT